MAIPRQVIHGEWFDFALQRLGNLQDVEFALGKELYRLACYADLVAYAPGSRALRIYQTEPLLREDGTVVRALIYFILRQDEAVELQHIEVIDD